jgi:putative RNA 2'-phosphotransferase
MLTEKEATRLSKFLSLILRHQPESIGIELDQHGWANVKELLEKARKNGRNLTIDSLNFIVENNAKKRFEFSENLQQIRASRISCIMVRHPNLLIRLLRQGSKSAAGSRCI